MFMLMFALQCLFPIFDAGAGQFVGLSITNTETQTREFTITGISPDGNSVQTGSVSLAAGTQRALLLNDIFGAAIASSAEWLRVDSSAPSCMSYMSAGNEEALIGVDAALATGTTVYLPHISINTGFMELNHTDTRIAIVNPGTAAATVTTQLYGLDGVQRGSISIAIPARGSRSVRVSESFASFMPDNGVGGRTFDGYIRLISNTSIAAWQRIDTPLSRSVLRGKALNEISSTSIAVIPHFAFGGTYGAFINLVNPTAAMLNLELTAADDRGNNIGETKFPWRREKLAGHL